MHETSLGLNHKRAKPGASGKGIDLTTWFPVNKVCLMTLSLYLLSAVLQVSSGLSGLPIQRSGGHNGPCARPGERHAAV